MPAIVQLRPSAVTPPCRLPHRAAPRARFGCDVRARGAGGSPRREGGQPPPPHEQGETPATPEATSAPRVLVVDDEAAIRLLCRVNLGVAGFEVTEAADGEQALELVASEDFDVILLDVMMPGLGGLGAARRLQESSRGRSVPIVFLSAHASRDDVRAGLEAGAVDYIAKPFDPLGLAERLRTILEGVRRDGVDEVRRRLADQLVDDA